MKILIQRVSRAQVEVDGQITGQINQGLLVFIGIEKYDELAEADKMIKRLLSYRVFYDADDKMNLSVSDVKGGVLLVSQFTLVADTSSGTRPGFSTAKHLKKLKSCTIILFIKCKRHIRKLPRVFLLLTCRSLSPMMGR